MGVNGAFSEQITQGYQFKGASFLVGAAMLNGEVVEGMQVRVPLQTFNRHGLIAGATGTGKTKTLQALAEGLSASSVSVLLLDIKGDLSGLAAAGDKNDKTLERAKKIGLEYKASSFPLEFLSISHEPGVRLRATVSEFGPVLLSRILDLNETQQGIMAMLFKYADDRGMPLVDLKDVSKLLQFSTNEGKKEIESEYGRISAASTGTILRKIIELQQQEADIFFGEPSFDVNDLMRISDDGRGMINVIRVSDMQNKAKLFSTFMLSLLAELYATQPEEGDLDRPKLVMFIDEAHLVFQEASDALLQQLESIIKLIRSKGIGIFFCTQNPQDIPAPILSQLGMKVQHALRAFTAADRKAIRYAAENYPLTDFYETDELLTKLGIGEALVTALNENGIPTPLVHTMMVPPASRMDILSQEELLACINSSSLLKKYEMTLEKESAFEILQKKVKEAVADREKEAEEKKTSRKPAKEDTLLDNPMVKEAGRTAANILTRSLLGALGLKGRKTKWF